MNDVAQVPVDTGTSEPSPPPAKSRRKIIRLAIAGVVLIALVIGGVAYWLHARHFVSTDDAYVNANTVDIAAYLRPLHVSPTTLALLAQPVAQQAAMTAIVDVFYFIAWSFVAMLPLVLLLRRRIGVQPPKVAME